MLNEGENADGAKQDSDSDQRNPDLAEYGSDDAAGIFPDNELNGRDRPDTENAHRRRDAEN